MACDIQNAANKRQYFFCLPWKLEYLQDRHRRNQSMLDGLDWKYYHWYALARPWHIVRTSLERRWNVLVTWNSLHLSPLGWWRVAGRSPILVSGSLEEALKLLAKMQRRSKENNQVHCFANVLHVSFECVGWLLYLPKSLLSGLWSLVPEMSLEVQPRNARLARLRRHERQPDARCQMDIEMVGLQGSSPFMTWFLISLRSLAKAKMLDIPCHIVARNYRPRAMWIFGFAGAFLPFIRLFGDNGRATVFFTGFAGAWRGEWMRMAQQL